MARIPGEGELLRGAGSNNLVKTELPGSSPDVIARPGEGFINRTVNLAPVLPDFKKAIPEIPADSTLLATTVEQSANEEDKPKPAVHVDRVSDADPSIKFSGAYKKVVESYSGGSYEYWIKATPIDRHRIH